MTHLQIDIATVHHKIGKLVDSTMNLKATEGVRETGPIGIMDMNNWEWSQGVALFAVYLYYQETRDSSLLTQLQNWFDRHIESGTIPDKNINTMCPLLTLSYLYEETGNEIYLSICKEWAVYAMEELPRTGEGSMQHIVSGNPNEGEIWDDTLYMTVLFVARMGALLKNDSYVQESIHQFLVHLKYLTDPKSGLFYHAWTFKENHHFAAALWARGNAWYTAGLVDYMDMITLPDGVRKFLLSSLERQVSKLSDVQSPSGMWHTLLLEPESYEETSATSAFAYGILKAVRLGYLPHSYQAVGMKAMGAVIKQIDEDGIVHGVSYGTGKKWTLQEYRDIPICPMPYGQSMALLMLVEGLKHIE